jgi:hypothetical protein
MKPLIAVAGSLAQKPGRGGHTWVMLQYLLGFRRLGWDVLFLDALSSGESVDANGSRGGPIERSTNLRYLSDSMSRIGLSESWALVADGGDRWFGVPRGEVLERLKRSAFLLNINGFLRNEQLLAAAPRRVFLDIDPGVLQIWHDLGLHKAFRDHDDYVTIGQRLGHPDCPVPTCGIAWITTPPPVVLEEWPVHHAAPDARFTTVASWRGAYGSLEYRGATYGQRVHEFRKFVDIPARSGSVFQLALDIHPDDKNDLSLLKGSGWSLVDPLAVGCDPWTYRTYIRAAKAEFMVAKQIYAATQCGWISDRSVCYLASGKPVIAQDTGLEGLCPTREGLVTFRTLEDALEAVREGDGNYDRHTRAARAMAEQYFDSDQVLKRLLTQLNVS